MRKAFLFCLIGLLAAGCQSRGTDYDGYYYTDDGCMAGEGGCPNSVIFVPGDAPAANKGPTEIRYSMPNGNDLVLETPGYVLQVEGAANKKYDYYVWTGEKTYNDDPDLIIQEGVAAVLKQ